MTLSAAILAATQQHMHFGDQLWLVRDLDALEYRIGDPEDFDPAEHIEVLATIEDRVWHSQNGFITQALRNMGCTTSFQLLSEV